MKIPRLELPSGGWIEFGDPDDLLTGDYRRLRGVRVSPRITGDEINRMYQIAAEVLITAWEVHYLGTFWIPRAHPELLDRLRINDTKALDHHLVDFITRYVIGDLPVVDGDPPPPVGGSAESSRETSGSDLPDPPGSPGTPTLSGTTDGSTDTPAGTSPPSTG